MGKEADAWQADHRIALSDSRLLDFNEEGDAVDLRYKDDRDASRHKVMTLSGEERVRQAARGLRLRSPTRWNIVYNRRRSALVSAPRPPRMPALPRSERRPRAAIPPGTDRRPWTRGFHSLSLKKTAPAASTVPGSD